MNYTRSEECSVDGDDDDDYSHHPGPQPPPKISHFDCSGVSCTQKKESAGPINMVEKGKGRVLLIWVTLCSVLGFGFVFGVFGVCPSLHKDKGRI